MALATQCPHCQTIFRVAHDQLKLRAGLVRCGSCKEIFNGIENLLRSEDTPALVPPLAAPNVTLYAKQNAAQNAAQNTTQDAAPNTAPTVTPAPEPTEKFSEDEMRWPDLPATPAVAASVESAKANPAVFFPSAFFDTPTTPASSINPIVHDESANNSLTSAVADPLDRMTLIHVHDEIDHLGVDLETPATTDEADGDVVAAEQSVSAALPVSTGSESHSYIGRSGSGSLVQPSTHETADELDQAIDYLQRRPWRGSKKKVSRADVEGTLGSDNDDAHHAEIPEFVARSRNTQRRRGIVRKLQYTAAALLTVAVAAQSAYLLHDQLAARLPASQPVLNWLCSIFGCRVGLPAQIDAVSIESNELTAVPSSKNNFSLNLLLRNRSSLSQRWPAIELTLLDGNDRPLVRRVFSPADYLPSTITPSTGFAQNTEQSARVRFEYIQQKAANYRVILFYP